MACTTKWRHNYQRLQCLRKRTPTSVRRRSSRVDFRLRNPSSPDVVFGTKCHNKRGRVTELAEDWRATTTPILRSQIQVNLNNLFQKFLPQRVLLWLLWFGLWLFVVGVHVQFFVRFQGFTIGPYNRILKDLAHSWGKTESCRTIF